MRPIAVYHEHPDWFRPLFTELHRRNIPCVRLERGGPPLRSLGELVAVRLAAVHHVRRCRRELSQCSVGSGLAIPRMYADDWLD